MANQGLLSVLGGARRRAGGLFDQIGSGVNRGLDWAAYNPVLSAIGGDEGLLASHRNRQARDALLQTLPPDLQPVFKAYPELATQMALSRPMQEAETRQQEEQTAYDRSQDQAMMELRRRAQELDEAAFRRGPTGSQAPARPVTPEDRAQWGLEADVPYSIREGEEPRPIGGTRAQQFTLEQSKVAGFANRMNAANQEIDTLLRAGDLDPTAALRPRNVGIPPGSQEFRQYDRAKREFASAVLRRETGATITREEFEDVDKRYFPQIGDGPDVLIAKAAARRRLIEDYALESGGAYESRYGQAQQRQGPQTQGPPDIVRTGRDRTTGRRVMQLSNGQTVFEDGTPYGG